MRLSDAVGRTVALSRKRDTGAIELTVFICRLRRAEHLGKRHAALAGHAGAIFVFRREHGGLAVHPAALALDRAPRRLDGARLAFQLKFCWRFLSEGAS